MKWILAIAFVALSSGALSSSAVAACREPAVGSDAVPALSPPLAAVVIGSGRLQFHSVPQAGCVMQGVFVIPKDGLIAYAQTRDWTSVMYSNPKTGNTVSGWVKSSRLKITGTVGPRG